MVRMAEVLGRAGGNFTDLRGVWDDGVDHTQSLEQRWWREHGRLPVHPNAAGHARLGEAIVVTPWFKKRSVSKGD